MPEKRGEWTILSKSELEGCKFCIFSPEHYNDDGSCRCTDPDHEEMSDWGYVWDDAKKRWESGT